MNELVINNLKDITQNSCFFITNKEFQIIDLNAPIAEFFNFPNQNFLGQNLLDLLSGKSAKNLIYKINNSSFDEKLETEIELISDKRQLVQFQAKVIPYVDKKINKLFFLCEGSEDTHQENYTIGIEPTKDFKNDFIVNSLDCALWAIDKDYKLIVFNDRFNNILKKAFNIEVYHGMKVFEFFNTELRNYWLPLHQRAFLGEKFSVELTYDDEIMEVSFAPILKEEQVTGITCLSRRITESKKFQEKLRISEEKYKKLVETSPMAIMVFDLDEQKIIEINQCACDLFKMTRKELLATEPWNLSPEFQEDGAASKERIFYNVMEVLQGKNLEFEWIHKDSQGNHVPCQVWLSMLPSKHKKQIRVSVLDISDRKRHQAEINNKKEKIRTIVSNVPVILWACDKNGILSFFDGDPNVLQRINPADAKNLSLAEVFTENDSDFEKVINLQNSKNDFAIQIHKNGRYYGFRGNRLTSNKNNFIGYTGILVDITERIENENKIKSFVIQQSELIKKIKQQEAGLYSLINSTTDLILAVDTELNIIEFNHIFNEMIKRGYDVAVEKGMNLSQFMVPEVRLICQKNLSNALSGQVVHDILSLTTRKGNQISMSVVYNPIYTDNGEVSGVSLIARDITESTRAQEQLVEINKQMAEYKLMALRSVMNPHFLFNSLNSIQYFVANNERRHALDYLSVFSILIRKILNSSINNTIPLNTELEILNYYIKLEQLRFENKFVSEIIIDPELIPEEIEVPSLLIQPYVENAILHGLTTKDEQGHLKIEIKKDNENLIIIVEDDGIGRELAAKLKKQNDLVQEKSYGMLVTEERLDIINKTADVSVKIEDLKKEDGAAAGTRVEIMIRINN